MHKILVITLVMFSTNIIASTSLEDKLKKLSIPDDKITPLISEDKIYVVNTRYSSLTNRHELLVSGANDFMAEGHLVTKQASIAYQYHLNPKWSFGLRMTNYFNELSEAGKLLFKKNAILADTDFALKSNELFTSYNTIYGKVRFSKDRVVYFDQYISLGLGKVKLKSQEQNMGIVDLGLSFWIGKNMSFRTGLKNEFYSQQQISGEKDTHNAMGYVSFGYLFGKGTL